MFLRAPRFQEQRDNGVPGPASYNPHEAENRFKRGAFLEREPRFKGAVNEGAETFGLYGTVDVGDPLVKDGIRRKRAVSGNAQLQRAEQEAARQSKRISELEDAAKGAAQARKDAKLSAAREAILQAELDKIRTQLGSIPTLRTQFDALVTEHANSKARYTKNTNDLKAVNKQSQDKLAASIAVEERLRAENLAKTREVGRLGDELGKLRSQKGEIDQQLVQAQATNAETTAQLEDVQRQLQEAAHAYTELQQTCTRQLHSIGSTASLALTAQQEASQRQRDADTELLLQAQYARLRAERKQLQAQDQISQLVEMIVMLQESAQAQQDRIDDLDELNNHYILELKQAEAARRSQNEAHREWLQEATLSNIMTREDLAFQCEEDRFHRDSIVLHSREADMYQAENKRLQSSLDHLAEDRVALTLRLNSVRSDFEKATEECATKDTHLRHAAEEQATLFEANTTLERDLTRTKNSLTAAQNELANEQYRLQETAKALATASDAEAALHDEVQSLQDDLTDYHLLQDRHEELQKIIDRLMRTSSLAEEDANQLARLNAELAGHSNPNQKIRHLERLRNELADAKRKLITTQADLASALRQKETLQSEVDAYKSVDTPAVRHLQASRPASSNTGSSLSRSLPRRSTLGDLKHAALHGREANVAQDLRSEMFRHKNRHTVAAIR